MPPHSSNQSSSPINLIPQMSSRFIPSSHYLSSLPELGIVIIAYLVMLTLLYRMYSLSPAWSSSKEAAHFGLGESYLIEYRSQYLVQIKSNLCRPYLSPRNVTKVPAILTQLLIVHYLGQVVSSVTSIDTHIGMCLECPSPTVVQQLTFQSLCALSVGM